MSRQDFFSSSRPQPPGSFFSSQAMLCVVALAALLGLLATLAYWYRPETGGGRAAACNPILVTFAEDAPLGKLNGLLARLDTGIAFGPDQNGAFELRPAGGNAGAVVDALNREPDVVLVASLREACGRAP
ncbi:hypothetical protein [Herbaspirillum sp.]|uniref:hypothetical protein n=1 Tax=Herbaspirillum sp. TaxID=1890675 RepID=UPI001B290C53|nr:hypothetical protein [Herbaspirillum sp.]MBO9538882.1 hypothetical protein [Herbaspirillum sp.]